MSWFGLIGGIASSLIGGYQQNQNINKQIEANKEENQRNRDWNLNLAKMQNRWSIDQWNRENAYNTPAAQKSRMLAAGLNPDLAYSQGGSFVPAAASPEMTAGSPSAPADVSGISSKKTFGQMFSDALQMSLASAQTENIGADTGKKKQETRNLVVENGILSADSLVKAASAESVIEYNKAKVYVAHNTADMLHSQSEYYAGKLNEIAASTDKLYAERDKLVAQLAEIDTNVVQKKFDMYMRSREFENACRKLEQDIRESDSRIAVNYQDVRSSVAMTMAQVLNLNVDSKLKIQQRKNLLSEQIGIEVANDQATFNFDQAKKWSDKQNRAEIANKWMTGIGIALGGFSSAIKSVLSGASPVKIAGFGR